MANRKAKITQAEISRALKATKDAGYEVARIEFNPQSGVKIFIGGTEDHSSTNEWDKALGLAS